MHVQKIDLIRFFHLHTIKVCNEPLRETKMRWDTYEVVPCVLTNKDRLATAQN